MWWQWLSWGEGWSRTKSSGWGCVRKRKGCKGIRGSLIAQVRDNYKYLLRVLSAKHTRVTFGMLLNWNCHSDFHPDILSQWLTVIKDYISIYLGINNQISINPIWKTPLQTWKLWICLWDSVWWVTAVYSSRYDNLCWRYRPRGHVGVKSWVMNSWLWWWLFNILSLWQSQGTCSYIIIIIINKFSIALFPVKMSSTCLITNV